MLQSKLQNSPEVSMQTLERGDVLSNGMDEI